MNKLTAFLSSHKNKDDESSEETVPLVEEELTEKIQEEKESRNQEEVLEPAPTDKLEKQEEEKVSEKEAEPPKPIVPKVIELPHVFVNLSFYGQPVRKVLYKKKLYFALDDIIAITGTIDLTKYLDKLKHSEQYTEKASEFVVKILTTVDNKPTQIDCIDVKGFEWLLPILQKDERFFLGPFPNWIKNISST